MHTLRTRIVPDVIQTDTEIDLFITKYKKIHHSTRITHAHLRVLDYIINFNTSCYILELGRHRKRVNK